MKEGHFILRFKSKRKKEKKERKRGHLRIIQRLYTMRNDG